jgi:hypothetical protein
MSKTIQSRNVDFPERGPWGFHCLAESAPAAFRWIRHLEKMAGPTESKDVEYRVVDTDSGEECRP